MKPIGNPQISRAKKDMGSRSYQTLLEPVHLFLKRADFLDLVVVLTLPGGVGFLQVRSLPLQASNFGLKGFLFVIDDFQAYVVVRLLALVRGDVALEGRHFCLKAGVCLAEGVPFTSCGLLVSLLSPKRPIFAFEVRDLGMKGRVRLAEGVPLSLRGLLLDREIGFFSDQDELGFLGIFFLLLHSIKLRREGRHLLLEGGLFILEARDGRLARFNLGILETRGWQISSTYDAISQSATQ